MADERKRIIQYPEATSLDDEDYLLGDSVIRGSRKVKVKDVIGVNQVNVDGTSVVDGNTANINLSGKQNVLTPGDNITINNDVISATDTTYQAGANVTIVGTTISAKDTTYTAGANITIDSNNVISADTGGGASYVAGDNITIEGNVISATDTTYTAGENVTITEGNVINSIPPYAAGENVTIDANNVISATNTTYTAGDNINISSDNVISGVATTYTAGTNITIDDNDVISATDTVYTAGDNITISDQNVISSTAGIYTAGENITIDQDNVISATDTTYSEFTEDEPGLVPAPGEPSGRVLMDDGSWDVPDNAIEINSGESPTDILETITTGEETYDAAVVRQTVNRDEDEDFALLGSASADDETETEGTNKFPDLTFNPVESSLSIDHIADTDTETDSDSSISITSTDVILNGTSSETRSRLQLTPSMWEVKHDATKTNIDFSNNQVAFYCDTTSIEDDTHQEIVYKNPIVIYTGSGDHRTTESYAIRYRIDAARSIVGEGDDFDICVGIKSTYVTDPYCEPTNADWVAVNTYSKYDIEGQLIEGRIDLDDSISDPNVYLYVIGNGWEMVLESIEVVTSQTDNTWDGAHASLKAAISEGMAGTVEQIESLGHEASLEVLLSYDDHHSTETDPARKTPKLIFNTKQGNLLVSDGDPSGPSEDPLTAENIMMITPEDIVMWEGSTWDGTNTSLKSAVSASTSDVNVTQTEIAIPSSSTNYELLFSGTADAQTHTEGANKSSSLQYDPYNRKIQVSIPNASASMKPSEIQVSNSSGNTTQISASNVTTLHQGMSITMSYDDIVTSLGNTWDGSHTSLKAALANAVSGNILSGLSAPTSQQGNNGDLYVRLRALNPYLENFTVDYGGGSSRIIDTGLITDNLSNCNVYIKQYQEVAGVETLIYEYDDTIDLGNLTSMYIRDENNDPLCTLYSTGGAGMSTTLQIQKANDNDKLVMTVVDATATADAIDTIYIKDNGEWLADNDSTIPSPTSEDVDKVLGATDVGEYGWVNNIRFFDSGATAEVYTSHISVNQTGYGGSSMTREQIQISNIMGSSIKMTSDDITLGSTWDGTNTSLKSAIAAASGGGSEAVYKTLAEYEALPTADKEDPTKIYFVINEGTKVSPALAADDGNCNATNAPAYAWWCLSGDASTEFQISDGGLSEYNSPAWWSYHFSTRQIFSKVKMRYRNNSSENRVRFSIQASNDASTWTEILVGNPKYIDLTTENVDMEFVVDTGNVAYEYIRLRFDMLSGWAAGAIKICGNLEIYATANSSSPMIYYKNMLYTPNELPTASTSDTGKALIVNSDGVWDKSDIYVECTQAEYDALPDTKNSDGIIYFITDNS